jgi:rubrerythrin
MLVIYLVYGGNKMSDYSEIKERFYEISFICKKCGHIVKVVKKSEERCLLCNNKDIRKPSENELEEIIDEFFC